MINWGYFQILEDLAYIESVKKFLKSSKKPVSVSGSTEVTHTLPDPTNMKVGSIVRIETGSPAKKDEWVLCWEQEYFVSDAPKDNIKVWKRMWDLHEPDWKSGS